MPLRLLLSAFSSRVQPSPLEGKKESPPLNPLEGLAPTSRLHGGRVDEVEEVLYQLGEMRAIEGKTIYEFAFDFYGINQKID